MASFHAVPSILLLVLIFKVSTVFTTNSGQQHAVSFSTCHTQYSYLNSFPAFYFLSRNSCLHRHQSAYVLAILIFLSGDIETNPGPTIPLNLCTLNVRSLFAPNRSVFFSDILTTENIDIFALSETFQNVNTTPAQLFDITPQSFQFLGQPRCGHSRLTAKANIGGGLGFLVKDLLCPDVIHLPSFSSFESFGITVKSRGSKLAIFNIYRLPDSSSYSKPFSTFISEFSSFLSASATVPHDFIITGDFNIHVNNQSDTHSAQFLSLLDSFNLKQHVSSSTHISNNILDLVITSHQSSILSSVLISPVSPSDHYRVMSSLNFQPPPPKPAILHTFRRIKSIDIQSFCKDIASSALVTNPPTALPDLVALYNNTLLAILDKHAPVQSKLIASAKSNPWYTTELRTLKCHRRRCEHQWRSHPSAQSLGFLRTATNVYNRALLAAKKLYYSELVTSNSANPHQLWNTISNILHRHQSPSLPTTISASSVAQSLAEFFKDKLIKLRANIPSTSVSPHLPAPATNPPAFESFRLTNAVEITSMIKCLPDKQCDLDPLPTGLLKKCLPVLAPTIANIVNLSLSTGDFPSSLKQAIVTTHSIDQKTYS